MQPARITLLTSLGAGLEYYDFVIYSLLITFISQQFFPSTNHTAALFGVFGVYAISNIIRPIGGVIGGLLGDRYGRKNVFANTLLWMAIATFLMGITPTFTMWGLVATVIFSIGRIIQGITCGAELPGALTFLLEHIGSSRRGLYFGFMVAAIGLGVSFGSFVIYILTKILSNSQMLNWGFRLPFILGGILAFIGFYIRKHIAETPAFLALQFTNTRSILHIVKAHRLQVCAALGILLFPACFITFYLILPTYLHDFYSYNFSDIYLVMAIGYLWSALLLPCMGVLSDYMGRKLLLILTMVIVVVSSKFIFALLLLNTLAALWAFILIGQTIIAAMAACYFVLLPQAFPVSIRYTATSFTYNVSYTIAAFFPLLTNYFYGVKRAPHFIVAIFAALAILTTITTLLIQNKSHAG